VKSLVGHLDKLNVAIAGCGRDRILTGRVAIAGFGRGG